ncbi:UNVERIFIED_CONTAM: hypothetical protein PYX00_005518 [Menopon gallinae]|uniref:Uncharacterized protein n=1 Tax=Menopon gallinae TaxID=328185 RepID=A0AAW2HSI1_9NEOP
MGGSVEEQNSGLTCLKYIVMSFNGILMMTGCFLVSIGITIYSLYHSLNTVLENRFFSPATLLFMIGCFIFIISIVGFVGVIKESTLVINTYCVLLGFICLLQISGVISAIILNGNLYGALNRTLNMTIRNYPYDTEASQAMDQIQRKVSN